MLLLNLTKARLFNLLTRNGTPYVYHGGRQGILSSVEREDGGGSSFNLTITFSDTGKDESVYVRTID